MSLVVEEPDFVDDPDMPRTMWFGPSWGAPVNDYADETEVPVGKYCTQCEFKIQERDRGLMMPLLAEAEVSFVPYHLKCFVSTLVPYE